MGGSAPLDGGNRPEPPAVATDPGAHRLKQAVARLVSAFIGMVLSVLALRYTHWDVFFFTFMAAMILSIMYWFDVGSELRAVQPPRPALRVLGILMGVPQALFGLLCVVVGTSIVSWVSYNLFVERQPEFPSLVLGLGVGPGLIVLGLGWLRYAFRRPPSPPQSVVTSIAPPSTPSARHTTKANLKQLIFGSPARTIDHPVFGKATLVETRSGAYWEAEPELDGVTIGVGIDTADGEEPSDGQVRFYRETTGDLTAAFSRAAPSIAIRYEEWEGKPLPADWRSVFRFAGLTVPVAGDDRLPWDIAFDCTAGRANGHLFTCYFERGSPAGVSVDG